MLNFQYKKCSNYQLWSWSKYSNALKICPSFSNLFMCIVAVLPIWTRGYLCFHFHPDQPFLIKKKMVKAAQSKREKQKKWSNSWNRISNCWYKGQKNNIISVTSQRKHLNWEKYHVDHNCLKPFQYLQAHFLNHGLKNWMIKGWISKFTSFWGIFINDLKLDVGD